MLHPPPTLPAPPHIYLPTPLPSPRNSPSFNHPTWVYKQSSYLQTPTRWQWHKQGGGGGGGWGLNVHSCRGLEKVFRYTPSSTIKYPPHSNKGRRVMGGGRAVGGGLSGRMVNFTIVMVKKTVERLFNCQV